jgi:uracil-DNA glycosylase
MASGAEVQEERFRALFRRIHAGHPACLADEWAGTPCPGRSIVWSRRNGRWRRSELLWVGAAPGNAGGRGGGELGAHATRIPFGGDVAGANLDVLLGAIGLDRNRTFIVAALNQLPAVGGGEPKPAELAAPVGACPSSLHVLRDTLLAVGPRLVVLLGNVALRATLTAGRATVSARLPSLALPQREGLARGTVAAWPGALAPDADFRAEWQRAWDSPLPALLWITHPSAQNMSPYARPETAFHTRLLAARAALRAAVVKELGWSLPAGRPPPPADGIYALPEWRTRIAPRHAALDALWRLKGV